MFIFTIIGYYRYKSYIHRRNHRCHHHHRCRFNNNNNENDNNNNNNNNNYYYSLDTTTDCNEKQNKNENKNDTDGIVIGFFHPYCSSGGGGERVLWKMIQVLDEWIYQQQQQEQQQKQQEQNCHTINNSNNNNNKTVGTANNNNINKYYYIKQVIVYTIDPLVPEYKETLLQHVKERFDVSLQQQQQPRNKNKDNDMNTSYLQFVHLPEYKYLLQPSRYLSLLVESIGTMRLSYVALNRSLQQQQQQQCYRSITRFKQNIENNIVVPLLPDLFIDTMGCAFTYIPANVLFGCKVIPYVHYPTISTDMLQLVWEQRRRIQTKEEDNNNDSNDDYSNNSPTSKLSTSSSSASLKSSLLVVVQIIKSYVKLLYYILFATLYGLIGSTCCTMILVNSTWTYGHIVSLWGLYNKKRIKIVYPPCNVQDLIKLTNTNITKLITTISSTNTNTNTNINTSKATKESTVSTIITTTDANSSSTISATTDSNSNSSSNHNHNNKNSCNQRIPAIVSIGQFRPEKDHSLQLESFAKLFELYPEYYTTNNMEQEQKEEHHNTFQHQSNKTTTMTSPPSGTGADTVVEKIKIQPRLVLIGSCRGLEDEERLKQLKKLAIQLNISNCVDFVVNQPYSIVQQWLTTGTVGIHTMWNEHFGIGIVEMMAAGLLTIAHNSGGPKLDIINVGTTGFLATTGTEYASCIHQALNMSQIDANEMRVNAQKSSLRFSDQVFQKSFQDILSNLLVVAP